MIRRWSCIIDINNNFNNYSFFIKQHKISLFKSSVNFKRFVFRYTKFKRKSLIRLKHRANWLIYTNVIKLWIKDYLFNKNYLRYQFFSKIFVNNFLFYNFNFIKNRNESLFYNFNFIFSTFTNNRYYYFYKHNIKHLQNTPLTVAWFYQTPITNNSILPIYSFNENHLISYNYKINFSEVNDLFDFLYIINIKKITEIRKITSMLFFILINKFKNVK